MIKKEDDMLANASKVLEKDNQIKDTDYLFLLIAFIGLFGNYGFSGYSTNELEKRLSKVEGQIDVLKHK